ncbi:MAG TPA: DUF4410 domain-containing protein [Verrucomicrobiota bacterium]|nr:DUF4410 domain-containing protein [Verrucomicrobiota bacterium]
MNITMRFLIRRWNAAVLAAGMALLLGGCQSAASSQATRAESAARGTKGALAAQPRPVAVCDFAFALADVQADHGLLSGREGPIRRVGASLRGQETPADKAARLANLLSETIAAELNSRKIPATRQPNTASWPTNGLVVKGEFVQVDEGNRLKRAVIGFGAGATEVLVQVEVFDLAQGRDKPILVYGTGKGSKPMPGGIITMNPYVMAAKYVLSHNATEKDVRSLGKRIAKDLAQVEAGAAAQP